jgi:hypothetical protein
MLRVLIRHAIANGWLKHDPSLGIKRQPSLGRLAKAGCTARETMAVLGHKTLPKRERDFPNQPEETWEKAKK